MVQKWRPVSNWAIPGLVGGTYSPEELAELISGGLLVTGAYVERPGGDLQYDGERPGPEWHAHGYMRRFLVARCDGGRKVVWKRRWLRTDDGPGARTCHSRPPDDLASVWFCATAVILKIWAWLDGGAGVCRYEEPSCIRQLGGSRRTVQRWLRRALPLATHTLQAVRRAVMERCEPRPMEQLFPRGVPPPEKLWRRPWREPASVSTLWQALAILMGGAVALNVSPPVLLAEARGRQATPIQLPI